MTDKRVAAGDSTDPIAFVVIRPGADGERVSVESMARGVPKKVAAMILRQVAAQWDLGVEVEQNGGDAGL